MFMCEHMCAFHISFISIRFAALSIELTSIQLCSQAHYSMYV